MKKTHQLKHLQKIAKLLNLNKPLIVFDLETTGLNLQLDRIIEIAYLKIFPSGQATSEQILVNPETEIPKEASAIHGITNETIKNKPPFRQIAQEIWEIFNNCHYSGFNIINFDLPLLKREFLRTGINFDYTRKDIIDAKVIFHYMEPRTLSAAYRFYCGKEHSDAHQALADVQVTAEILASQLEKYSEIQDWNFLHKIHNPNEDRFVDNERKFYWRNGEAYFAFSQYRDQPLAKIARLDPNFLRWILKANFSEETKNIARKALNGEFPQKPNSSDNKTTAPKQEDGGKKLQGEISFE